MGKRQSNCEWCGGSICAWASLNRRFCSRSCKALSQHQARREAGTPGTNTRKGEEVACAACGQPFYRTPAERQRGRRYCSAPCADAGKLKPPVVKQCEVCGAEMRLKPSQAARTFCSNACKGIGKTKRPLDRVHNGRRARKDDAGYVLIWEPGHSNQSQRGWQYEHRLIAEKALGRFLKSDEHVHHKNGVKDDNRPENLEVMAALNHAALSVQEYRDKVQSAFERLQEYESRYGPLT